MAEPNGNSNIRTEGNLDKNLHLTWVDGKTDVDVNFYHKGQDKSPVAAQLLSLNGKRSLNC
jgi:hypothetical protein